MKDKGKKESATEADTPQQQTWKPTWMFRLTTAFFIAATVGLAIGVLALVDHYLQFISVYFDGTDPRFAGKTVDIYYCMLSATASANMPSRCNYTFTVAAISLALSTAWVVHEASGRRQRTRLAHHAIGWAICWASAAWWLAAGIVLSIWTNEANQAGLPSQVQRNGLCAMAFVVTGFFSALALLKMFQPDSPLAQGLFGRKRKARKAAAAAATPDAVAKAAPPAPSTVAHAPSAAARVEAPAASAAAPAAGASSTAAPGGAWNNSGLAPGGPTPLADAV